MSWTTYVSIYSLYETGHDQVIDLGTIVDPSRVVLNLDVHSKRQALQSLAALIGETCELDADKIYRSLLEREKLGTTGIGHGLAIPHAKLEQLETVIGCFARLKDPVDFDAIDDEPVDMIFLILAPAESGANHLKALARVARIFRDETLCGQLRNVERVEDVMDCLKNPPSPRSS